VTPYSLADSYQRFGGVFCLHLHCNGGRVSLLNVGNIQGSNSQQRVHHQYLILVKVFSKMKTCGGAPLFLTLALDGGDS
jgi:hypothetical protein